MRPMDYSRPCVPKPGDRSGPPLGATGLYSSPHAHQIDVDDLTTFFVTYMKNDTLASIAQAHLANADYLEEGVKDEKCKLEQGPRYSHS